MGCSESAVNARTSTPAVHEMKAIQAEAKLESHHDNESLGKGEFIGYLPKQLGGVSVLFRKDSGTCYIDNSQLRADTEGLAYRRTKNIADIIGICAPWGTTVRILEESDDWVKCAYIVRDSSKDSETGTSSGGSASRSSSKSSSKQSYCTDTSRSTRKTAGMKVVFYSDSLKTCEEDYGWVAAVCV